MVNAPQHQGYRGGPPMPHGGGIGMNPHASDPRTQQRSVNTYVDSRMHTTTSGGGGYGNANNAPPQSYTSKFLSSLQADARDREQMQRTMMQQQQQQQSQQMHHHHQQQHQQGHQHLHQQQHHLHHQQQQQSQYLPPPPQHQQYQAQQQVHDHMIRQNMERHGSGTSSHSGGPHSNSYNNLFNHDSAGPGVTFISGTNSLASNSNDAFDEICNTAATISPTSAYALHGQARNTPSFFNENTNGAGIYDGNRMRTSTNSGGGIELDDQSTASRSRVPSYSSLYGGQVSRTQQPLSGYDRSSGVTLSPRRSDATPMSGNTNRFSNDSFFETSSQGGLDVDLYGNTSGGGKSSYHTPTFPNGSTSGSSSGGIHLSPPQYQPQFRFPIRFLCLWRPPFRS